MGTHVATNYSAKWSKRVRYRCADRALGGLSGGMVKASLSDEVTSGDRGE